MSSWTVIDVLTTIHNGMFIVLLFIGWVYIYMKAHLLACVSRLPSVAIAVYIIGLLFVTTELAFCVLMLTEYNKITNPDESISNAKIGLYVEIGLLSFLSCVGIFKLAKLFKGTYC
jgi:hypothetical protein